MRRRAKATSTCLLSEGLAMLKANSTQGSGRPCCDVPSFKWRRRTGGLPGVTWFEA